VKAISVEWATRIHSMPLEEFLNILHQAYVKKAKGA